MRFARGSDAIDSLIQHSVEFQRWFKERVQGNSQEIKTVIHNLRSAKHRFESFARPLGRTCLFLGPVLQTALRIALVRNDKQGAAANRFLQWVSTERCLCAAMLADGADESMVLTRFLDAEEADPAELNLEICSFMRRIHALFNERRCLTIVGYTSAMLKFLSTPMVFTVGNDVRSLGEAGGVPETIVESCLARMRCWVALARAACAAEFPHFEVAQAPRSEGLRD